MRLFSSCLALVKNEVGLVLHFIGKRWGPSRVRRLAFSEPQGAAMGHKLAHPRSQIGLAPRRSRFSVSGGSSYAADLAPGDGLAIDSDCLVLLCNQNQNVK